CSAFQAAFVLYFPPQVTLLLTCGYENMAFQATGLSRTQVINQFITTKSCPKLRLETSRTP
ncbi:MAG: hypothetical protein LBM67_04530, partial [Lentimicrobiaceae bacterium]|nr:hypothetical protein [Lentimicrobiaceae bacterium]